MTTTYRTRMDLTRRGFGIGLGAAGIAAFLASCSGSDGGSSGSVETKTVTTPLGTYDIPVNPKRVIAIDSRLDLEAAVALELPIIGYNHSPNRPWVPLAEGVPFLTEIPNREQILSLEPDLIICVDSDSEWWPVTELSTIAPVLTTDFAEDWRTNIDRLAGWLGRTATLDKLTLDYDALIDRIRAEHAEKIAAKTVASISYLPESDMVYVSSIRTTMKGDKPSDMTLADLGGITVTADGLDEEGGVSMENVELLAGCDGFMITEEPDVYAALMNSTLWQRLPAVQAGNVTRLGGATYYGSIYTIGYVAEGWNALYERMS